MNQVQNFAFGQMDVRVIEQNGQPWFVAGDVCRAIGYAVKPNGNVNVYHALNPLNDDEIMTRRMSGNRGTAAKLISESGLYKLIMRSDKPEAKAFQDWVTRVILPAIRKDGAYVLGEEKVATGELSEDELVMRAMNIMSRKVDRLTQERDQLARRKRTGQFPTPPLIRNRTSTASKVDSGNAHKRSPSARNEYGCKS
jgi:Prophage antirepressor